MIASPKNSAAPKRPIVTKAAPWATLFRWIRDASAMMPPSPRLCARMMKPAYLTPTTMISAQKISETTP